MKQPTDWVVSLLATALFISIDVFIYWARTEGMAPVGLTRLILAIAFQAIAVLAITAFMQPSNAPIRRFLEDTHKALPIVMALGGTVLGIGLAVGALHYSNCSRWDFNRGVMCTAV